MKAIDSLKQVERRAYRSTFDDGVYDIFFGMGFLILGWIPVLRNLGVPRNFEYLPFLVLPLILWLGKRYITIPRLGAVEFSSKRKARRLLFLVACAGFFLLTLPLLIIQPFKNFGADLSENVGLPMAVGMVAGPRVIAMAYFLDCPRMYIYAALLFFALPHSGLLHDFIGSPLNTLISMGLPGLVILTYGLTLLVNFMKKYPRPTPEVNHAG